MPNVRPTPIDDLRAAVAGVEARPSVVVPFGIPAIDGRLAGSGLAMAALHDAAAASPDLACDAAATLFLAGVVARLAADRGQVLWIVTRFDLYAPGLEQAGLAAARTIHAEARDDAEALALAEDALVHGGVSAVVAEVARAPMIATRRLQLAAERGGAPVLLLRRRRRRDACPLAEPSAATSRWRIGAAPSAPLTVPGLGRARWNVELVRQRGGNPFSLVVEACDAQGRIALPAAAVHRAAASGGATAARAA